MMDDAVNIEGHRARSIALTANVAAETPTLNKAVYAVWSDVTVSIRVAGPSAEVGNRATDVQLTDGYRILVNNVEQVNVDHGRKIGAIAASGGTLYYHRIG